MDEKTNLFEKVFGVAMEVIELAKKPIKKAGLKRKFRAVYDNAESQKIDALAKLDMHREKMIKDADGGGATYINMILEAKETVSTLSKMQADIKDEYKIIFGDEMKTIED